jgi:hypothetical protein
MRLDSQILDREIAGLFDVREICIDLLQMLEVQDSRDNNIFKRIIMMIRVPELLDIEKSNGTSPVYLTWTNRSRRG